MKKNFWAKILLFLLAVIVSYPFIWLFTASFKNNTEIFASPSLFPQQFTLEGYINGWKGIGENTFALFLNNSFWLVIPTVLLTVVSSCLVAYGFARFEFPLKKFWFAVMISTMMLPNTIIMIPRYILFRDFGWLDSYRPFFALAALAANPFFTYLLVQFFRGIPIEMDESAYMDGCTRRGTLLRIIIPLAKTPIISVVLFQFIWTWNDFANPLIYVNSTKLYPVSLGLRLAIDSESAISWNKIIAMSVVSMLPCIALFLSMQKYFVEGIATSGLKG
ncbi:MAG TPA: carbohydrate ABC transporter permease [Bacillota bacterium]